MAALQGYAETERSCWRVGAGKQQDLSSVLGGFPVLLDLGEAVGSREPC